MPVRFMTIWFPYLHTDWFVRRQPDLKKIPFVLATPDHGRMLITEANRLAQAQGIDKGMEVADARALFPSLQVIDDAPGLSVKLLRGLAEWCIRYTPSVAIDPPDGLILDVTGCAHLFGGEEAYLKVIIDKLNSFGYHARAAMADTIGAAWAIAHFGKGISIIKSGEQQNALLSLPPAALRLETATVELLQKLGLRQFNHFIAMPLAVLRRRFGSFMLQRLSQALGHEEEIVQPIQPIVPYQERLPCLEPIVTATGIEIALQELLNTICHRLKQEQKGLRNAIFKAYRVDGKIEKISVGTNRPSHNIDHLFKLFALKIDTMEPALGIELFLLEASKVEDVSPVQEQLWNTTPGLDDPALAELLDRIAGKLPTVAIQRYLPDEHYWPERSIKATRDLNERSGTRWKIDRPRPIQLLAKPERIEVTAPIPDYPPMLFRYKGQLHKIAKADGPERIEQEWWLQQGEHRDYYYVEDEEGRRYWLFRLGHYTGDKTQQWYIHGFFA